MRAKLAYLTTPAPGIFVMNFQVDDAAGTPLQLEISKAHLANILIDGTALALRELNRVPEPIGAQMTGG